ncbi:MAG: RecQ family ATP-dependent DNA helicase [Candidatus Binatia bacterium]|nr:RecQ family ATP-dependent DNA helicase [Candidatus Binatia bacterium]
MAAGPMGRASDQSSNAGGGGGRRRRRGRGHKRGGRGRPGGEAAPEVDVSSLPEPKNETERAARRIGIRQMHPEQESGINAALEGSDVLMVLPTGFGKSAVYQILSMLMPKPVVLVSPLLALLRDQHEKLIKYQVPCVRLDGTVRGKARAEALERIKQGGPLLVMTTPETLGSDAFAEVIQESGISLAAIDEAHCISEWGYDFRPAYQRLGERLRAFGAPPLIALTATATEKVREDIVRFLGMRDHKVVASSPHRSNLAFEVMICRDTTARLRALARLAQRLRRPGIIYCTTTREVDTVYAMLMKLGIPAHRYHGKMNAGERNTQQELFMKTGRRTVMVATSAFGLGIDKPDIRYVVHQQSPASLEQYVQEAGRGGRDGAKSNCILLYDPEDRTTHEALLGRSRLRPEQLYRLGRALSAWAGEGRTPDVPSLALSAELGDRATTALLVPIEEAEIIEFDEHNVVVKIPPEEVAARVKSLAGQFENLRTQDSRRLDSLADYANNSDCRATYLRSYFGEDDGEPCGLCDTCRGRPERPSTFFQAIAAPPKRGKKRGRGGKGGKPETGRGDRSRKKRAGGGQPQRGQKAQGDQQQQRQQPRDRQPRDQQPRDLQARDLQPRDQQAQEGQPGGSKRSRRNRRRRRRGGQGRGPGQGSDAANTQGQANTQAPSSAQQSSQAQAGNRAPRPSRPPRTGAPSAPATATPAATQPAPVAAPVAKKVAAKKRTVAATPASAAPKAVSATAKKASTAKEAAKKTVAKKAVAAKTVSKKVVAKAAPAAKAPAAKKSVAKKTVAKKVATTAKKAVAKKATAKKAPVKKAPAKKVAAKAKTTTVAAKKAPAKKAPAKKVTAKKTAAKKTPAKKVTAKKAAKKTPKA